MNDPRFIHRSDKIQNFFFNLFEDPEFVRMEDSRILNDAGYLNYFEKYQREKRLDQLNDLIHGKFQLLRTFSVNFPRFLFQWTEGLMSRIDGIQSTGFALGRAMPGVVFGGALNAGTVLAANHYAANRAYRKEGLSVLSFWLWSQVYQLLAIPVVSYSLFKMNGNAPGNLAIAFSPARLAFNSIYTLAVGMYNSNNQTLQYLYYPTIVASALILRLGDYWAGFLNSFVQRNSTPISASEVTPKSSLMFVRSSLVAITAFTALNFFFPITLPQRRGKQHYEGVYKQYLNVVK